MIELQCRSDYMAALDEASSCQNIVPFATFVAASMRRETARAKAKIKARIKVKLRPAQRSAKTRPPPSAG